MALNDYYEECQFGDANADGNRWLNGPFILAGIGMVIALGGAGTFIKIKSKSKKQRTA